MKLYSYDTQNKRHLESDEITIQANPKELRRLASFILNAAELMEKYKDTFSHEHLQDFERKEHGRKPDVIVSCLNE